MSELPAGRSVRFVRGYDLRHDGRHGVHGMQIEFYLRGEEGAVHFKMSTDWIPWLPRPVQDSPFWGPCYQNASTLPASMFPTAVDLGYHSPRPLFEGSEARDDCPYLGGPCHYDGSGLNAEPLMVTLIYDGEAAMWEQLAEYYRETFQP